MTGSIKISPNIITPTPYTTYDKELITGFGFPSNNYIDLTLGASGTTYTALADGEISIIINMTGAYSNMQVMRNSLHILFLYGAGVIPIGGSLSVKKGDTFKIQYSVASGTPTKNTFRFTYAEGVKPTS